MQTGLLMHSGFVTLRVIGIYLQKHWEKLTQMHCYLETEKRLDFEMHWGIDSHWDW
jgi:hypothetical protein